MNLHLFAFLALVPFAAQSQQAGDLTFVDCTAGQGCRCALSDVTAEEVAIVLGDAAANPEADKMILLNDSLGLRWSRLSPDQADASYGGDGVCPIELFPPVIPQDGTWVGKVRTSVITGCPAPFDQMLPAMTDAMVMTRQITWNGSFDPARFGDGPASTAVRWEELSPNIFSGDLVPPAQSAALSVDGRLSASLTTQDAAVATMWLRVAMDGGAAGALLAQAGLADCRVTANYSFVRTGP